MGFQRNLLEGPPIGWVRGGERHHDSFSHNPCLLSLSRPWKITSDMTKTLSQSPVRDILAATTTTYKAPKGLLQRKEERERERRYRFSCP